jgi:hypothetical protein
MLNCNSGARDLRHKSKRMFLHFFRLPEKSVFGCRRRSGWWLLLRFFFSHCCISQRHCDAPEHNDSTWSMSANLLKIHFSRVHATASEN